MSKSKHKIRVTKKQVIIALSVVAVLLVAAGAGVGLRWFQNSQNAGTDNGLLEDKLPANIKEAQNLALSGKAEESNKQLQDQLAASNIGDQEKFELLFQQAVNYANQKEYQKAIDVLKQAEAIKSEFRISNMIAEMALLANNKPLAVEYFTKALPQLDPTKPLYNSEKARLEQKLKDASS